MARLWDEKWLFFLVKTGQTLMPVSPSVIQKKTRQLIMIRLDAICISVNGEGTCELSRFKRRVTVESDLQRVCDAIACIHISLSG